eukprot:symbB.v1.2.007397.t1/scaffold452.1/size203995/10
MAGQRLQMQERRGWVLLLAALAYVSASTFGEAWLIPTSRRAAASAIVAGLVGTAPALAQEAEEGIYKEFRGWFAEFAKEGQSVDTRAELLGKMQDVTLKEKMLPIGITREDVVKGVRAVKFNEGCIKDKIRKDPECKKLEKAYQKFLASIDKVYDRSLVTAR